MATEICSDTFAIAYAFAYQCSYAIAARGSGTKMIAIASTGTATSAITITYVIPNGTSTVTETLEVTGSFTPSGGSAQSVTDFPNGISATVRWPDRGSGNGRTPNPTAGLHTADATIVVTVATSFTGTASLTVTAGLTVDDGG